MAPDVNPSRVQTERFAERAAARGTGPDFRVLDAGAGSAPYRHLFAHLTYESADVALTPGKDYDHLTYRCDLVDIPVEDGRFDLVWCSQVLEHCRDPRAVMAELARVLKPGGELWASAPLYYAEHEQPWDFWRFTQYGWRELAAGAGLDVVELEWLEGAYGTVSYSLTMAAKVLPAEMKQRKQRLRRWARELAELDLAEKRTDVGMPKNYAVVLRRPR